MSPLCRLKIPEVSGKIGVTSMTFHLWLTFAIEISFPLGFLRSNVPPALPSKPGLCSRGLPVEHTSICQCFASILGLSRFCAKHDYKKIRGSHYVFGVQLLHCICFESVRGQMSQMYVTWPVVRMVNKQDRRTLWQNQLSACANEVPAPHWLLKWLLKMAGSGDLVSIFQSILQYFDGLYYIPASFEVSLWRLGCTGHGLNPPFIATSKAETGLPSSCSTLLHPTMWPLQSQLTFAHTCYHQHPIHLSSTYLWQNLPQIQRKFVFFSFRDSYLGSYYLEFLQVIWHTGSSGSKILRHSKNLVAL